MLIKYVKYVNEPHCEIIEEMKFNLTYYEMLFHHLFSQQQQQQQQQQYLFYLISFMISLETFHSNSLLLSRVNSQNTNIFAGLRSSEMLLPQLGRH